ncbi:MAG: hypothetical protein EAZ60_22115 [Oscillatoriales cyanobacterium]|nr:MAG: hypothetical protein EAZ83_03095 [Oscillatoriales cyanobacterium]TAE99041.1 MAG: hypothetical protein EAZ79_06165 [Oscillatoriales cyanobacterium]TAF23001.1 MAG: hypothetical protein EAZ73_03585 [Oscillatoriales cyanobacterium]TAF39406.1 MAG: hypothetical protein EAZ69_00560 [Oscillatoriales cyanobacterium]TAF52899.1 MAG: hypothetical protein EAZ60_22115 [Oscillatoriales cyanobacterium]
MTRHYTKLVAIRAVKVLAAFFMRNKRYFVIKIYHNSRTQQFSAQERDRTIANLATSLIVT